MNIYEWDRNLSVRVIQKILHHQAITGHRAFIHYAELRQEWHSTIEDIKDKIVELASFESKNQTSTKI